jgi:outer membrane protein assembly factor BamB
MSTFLRQYFWLACMFLLACSRGNPDGDKPLNLAEAAQLGVVGQVQGSTPFIGEVTLVLEHFADLTSMSYSIAPKAGTFSKPVSATFDKAWLGRPGRYDSVRKRFSFPVFGLYADHANAVTLKATFSDGSSHTERLAIQSARYAGPAAVYGAPTVLKARTADSAPGVDFVMIKNSLGTPAVIDTDGNLRWVGSGIANSFSSVFTGDAFLVGSSNTPDLYRLDLNGTFTVARLSDPTFTNFHHDVSVGKTGYLVELDVLDNGVPNISSVVAEVNAAGQVLKQWDLPAIFRRTMQAGGDNPANFVRDGADWFHMNSAIYSAADNSLLVSSRENFVVKLDYETGNIKWILGDSTKHWYVSYPSLRALALKLTSGNAPIGQHSLSITADGSLLLFNNGLTSLNNPPGTAPGANRLFSFPSRYAIDEQARTAREVWRFQPEPAVYSDICSSVYEGTVGKYLVAYSVADGSTHARLTGVDAAGTVAFDFEYPTTLCATVFIAQPVDLAALLLK